MSVPGDGPRDGQSRGHHSAPVIGESLYLWAGTQLAYDSNVVETFSLSSGLCSSHLARGIPPLGVAGYSCTTFRSNIYYYAGWRNYDDSYYNSLNALNTLTMSWTQLHPDDESMMKKAYGGMLSLEFDGIDYLFMVGGYGPTPAVKHPQFQYEQIEDHLVRTNEQLLYNLSNRQFIVPSVSGQCCPPTSNIAINKTNQNKGVMFGGQVAYGDSTNTMYIFNVTHNTIHWESVKKGSMSGKGLLPKGRYDHASAIITGDSTSPALVVIGGLVNNSQLVNDCLLFDNITTGQYSCKKVPLPESVTGRYSHSLTAVTMSPNCVWLVIVGGFEEIKVLDVRGGIKSLLLTLINDINRQMMIIELVQYIEAGEWIVQSVLDGNDLTSKKYQEKYSSYNKTRTWWIDQLMEYPTAKEMKLQRYIQSLHQELQVAHQNKVSLQEALIEANKQGKGDDTKLVLSEKFEEMLKALQEEKQIITEDNEKLRATVADNEVYITQMEEEKKHVEEQYLKEKQITEELKAKVADNELYTSKLLKEREQLQERVTSLEKKSIKETTCSSKEIQFNYLIPSMDNLECLSDVQVHCIDLTGRPALSHHLKFAIAPVNTPSLPYQFSILEGGEFSSNGGYGFIKREDFCLVCILGLLIVSMAGGGGGGQQQQGGEVVPAQQQQGGDALTVLTQQQQQQIQEQQGEQSQEVQQEEGELQEEGGNQQGEEQRVRQSQKQSELPEQQQQQEGGQPKEKGGGDYQEGDRGQEEGHKDDPVHIETATDAVLCTESSSKYANSLVTNVQKNMKYAGLIYYEEKGVEDLVTFTAAKKLDALIQYIERKHSQAEIGPDIFFQIKFSYDYIELNLTAQQDEPFTGWTVKAHTKPSRLYQEAIDNFGDKEYSRPSCCLISVYGSPIAVPTLHYSIPLEGVADPVSLIVHRARRKLPPSTVHESMSVPSTGRISSSSTYFDVNKVKKVIDKVLVSHHARLNCLTTSLSDLANQLYEVGLISDEVRETRSMDKFIAEFKASFHFMDKMSDVQDHCKKFLNSFIAVRGSYINAANFLRQKWIEAMKIELGIDFIIDISA
ncbi:PREDICTED: uncharacterized protein LOC109582428 [Amphimedon queenslandica]|uniref:Uncharacterized protein n=1 Tax=Amphimedon queenslandica TaxID=400682 RepID=A0AAN0J7G6_AMPQE|nr:PREDICTED: uncharacterized protein LOC109582428 [Amphimedon queenslandica]|eukprot:XP_019852692.1 PREDICTED: uncharacterized protein LOC109582428 [Amphimedon queenslandica]